MKNLLTILCFILCAQMSFAQKSIDLSGTWAFAPGSVEDTFPPTSFIDTITLPGTTDEAHKGEVTVGSDFGILTRTHKFIGLAWYSTTINVTDDIVRRDLFLELERVMWRSVLWVDGVKMSTCDALNSKHSHYIGRLSKGEHNLTLSIDNSLIYNIGDKGHAYTEYTQTIWNGAVGRIRVIVKDVVSLDNPQIYTTIDPVKLTIIDTLKSYDLRRGKVSVKYSLKSPDREHEFFSNTKDVVLTGENTPISFSDMMPETVQLWDDVNPNIYHLTVTLTYNGVVRDTKSMEIGFREVTASKSKVVVNGREVFLRGNLDCVHFPLTGYPSCKVEDWEHIFRIYKSYGLNHVRFHSWCPPEAAFVAANRLGIYIQSEVLWIDHWMTNPPKDRPDMITKGFPEGLGKNQSANKFVVAELDNMVVNYGNNPSFIMMCIGNELGNSDFDVMEGWIKRIKERDDRRLYSVSAARKITPTDQYMVTHYIDGIGAARGLRVGGSTDWDFEDVYSKINIPVIAHEIGQWPVYPRWSEIKKYTGVLRARNFEEFKASATKNHVADQNEEFVNATGALNQIMYKYEIESFLRTPSCGGIQLLSMQDYQGQGEALIGWLDVFHQSKGITTPEKFRRHHSEIVPLARIGKFVWSSDEIFNAKIQLAQYSNNSITDKIYWNIVDEYSRVVARGEVDTREYKSATSVIAAEIKADLKNIVKAQKLTLNIGLESMPVENSWNIWVFPAIKAKDAPEEVYVTRNIDKSTEDVLAKGGKVLLVANDLGIKGKFEPLNFNPLYWSSTFFPGQGINTLGLLIRDKHPMLSKFPTDSHSDWQWESIHKNSRGFMINSLSSKLMPIVQPIDDFHRNEKLGAIFELKVGSGKVVVCGFDILNDGNIVANTLKNSITEYMLTAEFNPEISVSVEALKELLPYREPAVVVLPEEFKNAFLYIECANNVSEQNKSLPWAKSVDKCVSLDGVSYNFNGDGVWSDAEGKAWHSKEATLTINCPEGMIGTLYLYFHDWNNQNRTGALNFEGREYPLEEHSGKGRWVKLHVMREDTNNGTIVLKWNTLSGGNLMLSKVVLL